MPGGPESRAQVAPCRPAAAALTVGGMDRSATDRKRKAKPALEGVAAVDRALTLLSAFRKGDTAVSLAELAERTGLVKSTIMRLAISLEEHGYYASRVGGAGTSVGMGWAMNAKRLIRKALLADGVGFEPTIRF